MSDAGSSLSRRRFLGGVAGGAAAVGALSVLPSGMAESFAEPRRRGSLADVEHVVVLMQENRSFDHYYGTMRGVRGFADPVALRLRSGKDVYQQPDQSRTDGGLLLPFHVDTSTVDGQDLGDLGHGWADQHQAVNGGRNDNWVAAKSEMTMGYFTESDIPFHRALADAFTLCDNYFCSIQGPTTPNRLYLFTGTIDAEGKAGGPATGNPPDYQPVYHWTTYPERLQDAGISWKVYANKEVGDDGKYPFCGDYGDNPLWLFQAYHDALRDPAKRELADRASVFETWQPDSGQGKDVGHVLADFAADCTAGTLPKVSWVVAPYGYCEHPESRPVDGAAYIQGVLNALWANPKLWESTVLLINYDENDGFFDHVPPPMAPPGTPGEYAQNLSIGLGTRVPMTVISPWSRGGWVNSQVFEHTSVLRFLERWTGVHEPNISAWRRAVSGDLTSCFDFARSNTTIPLLPDTAKLRAQADATEPGLPKPTPPPTGHQTPPTQDPGTRPARPIPYQPTANATLTADHATLDLTLTNQGTEPVNLMAVRGNNQPDGPWHHLIPAHGTVSAKVDIRTNGGGHYDLILTGPNGFHREIAGFADSPSSGLEVTADLTDAPDPLLHITIRNSSRTAQDVTRTANHYRTGGPWTHHLAPGESATETWPVVHETHGWYDFTVTTNTDPEYVRRFAGHVENGKPSITG